MRCAKTLSSWRSTTGAFAARTGGALYRQPELFCSEASVYRLRKARDLIASPAFIVVKAADGFKDKTTTLNQLWQTDFIYRKVIGWGCFDLWIVLDCAATITLAA